MPQNYGKRLPMDSRIPERISKDPHMLAEQGSGFLSDWGGSYMYRALSKMSPNDRQVYFLVKDQTYNEDDIATLLELSPSEVSKSVNRLAKKGYIDKDVVVKSI